MTAQAAHVADDDRVAFLNLLDPTFTAESQNTSSVSCWASRRCCTRASAAGPTIWA